jgi:DNA modification methylase
MRRSNRAQRFESAQEPFLARVNLERKWRERLTPEPRLATLVTAQGNTREPFHRWLPYRQGFSPGLVRLFLNEEGKALGDEPLIDPFSGSGTTITESARQHRSAIGVEAIPALVFLAASKFEQTWTDLPAFDESLTWEAIADRLELPLHRAALMIAHARLHTGAGALNRSAPPIAKSLAAVADMVREDLQYPLPLLGESRHGDARELDGIEDESISALITSPPYLSRYDYLETNDPIETVYRRWYDPSQTHHLQVRANPSRRAESHPVPPLHPAAVEARDALLALGHRQPAQAVLDYFTDMRAVLDSAHRVLTSNAPAWLIVGGVRLKDIYVPTDLILAEIARQVGFTLEGVRVARELNPVRRKFGSAGHLAPRETLLAMRKT